MEHLLHLTEIIKFKTGCFIKIDAGNKRTGVEWNDFDKILRMVSVVNENKYLRMKGFLMHNGHSYLARSVSGIKEVYHDALSKTNSIREAVRQKDLIFSTGDTPTCSLISDFTGYDEIRPGNFVFYDIMQYQLGSCRREQIAVAVFCPVVDINEKKNEVLIYGGAVHLSKESIFLVDGSRIYGEVAFPSETGWSLPEERIFVKSISQEHGIISVPERLLKYFKRGELIAVLPVHSCLTADILREYHTFDGRVLKDLSPK